jgi:hypothetical protein
MGWNGCDALTVEMAREILYGNATEVNWFDPISACSDGSTIDCAAAWMLFVGGPGKFTKVFATREAARRGFSGLLGAAANRFFRGATSKSINFEATCLENGVWRFEYFSPANNPGYGKRYIQEVDAAGTVLREWKETWGPDGLIEVKWVHGGP